MTAPAAEPKLPKLRVCKNCFVWMLYKRTPQQCNHCGYVHESQRKKAGAAQHHPA